MVFADYAYAPLAHISVSPPDFAYVKNTLPSVVYVKSTVPVKVVEFTSLRESARFVAKYTNPIRVGATTKKTRSVSIVKTAWTISRLNVSEFLDLAYISPQTLA